MLYLPTVRWYCCGECQEADWESERAPAGLPEELEEQEVKFRSLLR